MEYKKSMKVLAVFLSFGVAVFCFGCLSNHNHSKQGVRLSFKQLLINDNILMRRGEQFKGLKWEDRSSQGWQILLSLEKSLKNTQILKSDIVDFLGQPDFVFDNEIVYILERHGSRMTKLEFKLEKDCVVSIGMPTEVE